MNRRNRVIGVIADALRGALDQAGGAGIALVDGDSIQTALAAECCIVAVGADRTARQRQPDFLTAGAANKTALLLSRDWPEERLLPLGDLYASQVLEIAGGYAMPDDAAELIDAAGGLETADRVLQRWLDARHPPEIALADLPETARGPFLEAVRRGRFWRERCGLVPKLSARTIGIDLFA